MKTRTFTTLTAVLLSAAGVMEAQGFRVQSRRPEPQFQQRRPEREPMNRPEHRARNITPEARVQHARSYNSRPGGVHINPDYFASHYGYANGFHFSADPFREYGGELYFNFNGGWFGVIRPVPGNWALQAESFYIGMGDDGNYYLYNMQYPNVAVQLTFVQNVGDDQAGGDEDQGDDGDQDDQ
jgi:hypothetical protein